MTTAKTKIKPLGSRVLIKRSEAKVTKGGILLPDTAQEKPKEGEVIATGPGKTGEDGSIQAMTISVSDKVLFTSYAGTEVKIGDDDFLIMSEDDILGILN